MVSANPHSRNFYNSLGDPDDVRGNGTEILKIAVDLRFVRYFITSADGLSVLFYGDYALHNVSDMTELAEQLGNILSKDALLGRSFAAVRVCWFTDFEIIPTAFFDSSELADTTTAVEILGGDARFIFEVPEAVADILQARFISVVHWHSGAAMIEQLRKADMAKPDSLYINVHAETIEVVYFGQEGALKIYNSYEYKAYQDYIYFVLLVADEMQLNRHDVKAVLMGEISADSQLYEVTNRYFAHLEFIRSEGVTFSRAFEEYPKHFNYPLYNL